MNNTLVYGAEFEYDRVNPVLDTTNVDNLKRFNNDKSFKEKDSILKIKFSSSAGAALAAWLSKYIIRGGL